MRITEVMQMTSGVIVCRENGATITITTKNDTTTFEPGDPVPMPPLPSDVFHDLYKWKTFDRPSKSAKKAADSAP